MLNLAVPAEAFAAANVALRGPDEASAPAASVYEAFWNLEGEEFIKKYVASQDPRVAEAAKPFLHLFDPPSSQLNTFSKWRRLEGLPVAGLRVADLREAEAKGAVRAAGGA